MTTGMRLASENEYKILKILWEKDEPLSRADILRETVGRNWNPASIHLILNSMISKELIKITDEEKKYGRTYEPTISYEEYLAEVLTGVFPDMELMDILKDCNKMYNRLKKESK